MLTKILAGGFAVTVTALLIVSGMLLAAREDLGESREAVRDAAASNETLLKANQSITLNRDALLEQIERQREETRKAQQEKERIEIKTREEIRAANIRIRNAETRLSESDINCARSNVPDSLYRGMRNESPGHP